MQQTHEAIESSGLPKKVYVYTKYIFAVVSGVVEKDNVA